MNWIRFCLLILQIFLSVWCFHAVVPQAEISRIRQMTSHLLLLLLFPLFMGIASYATITMDVWGNVVRFFWRVLIYTVYLRSLKKTPWRFAVYLALVISTIFTACQVIVQIILISHGSHPFYNLLYIPVILFATALLPISHLSNITLERKIIIALIVICVLYTKTSFFDFSITGKLSIQSHMLPTYLILLHAFLILFLIFFERYAYKAQESERYYAQEIQNDYLLRSLKVREVNDRELRSLHHDMKNHFLAIQEMARQEHCSTIQHYTQDLLGRSTAFEFQIHTGNHLLNGLLEEKCSIAKGEHIQVEISLNFHTISYIDSVDLCTIFANALDNAIEACKKVSPSQNRYIRISSTVSAQHLFVTIKNSYEGILTFQGDWPVTTKYPAYRHGYGLSNLQRAVQKYSGAAKAASDEYHGFVLTLVFPIPE